MAGLGGHSVGIVFDTAKTPCMAWTLGVPPPFCRLPLC